jgi:hypothetical protein
MVLRRCLVGLAAAVVVGVFTVQASAISQPQKLNFLDVTEVNHVISGFEFNRPPQGGDSFASTDGLYKWAGTKKGARAGRLETFCTVSFASGSAFTVFCKGEAFLAAGSVLAEGWGTFPFSGPAKFTLPVVGGTGAYANVRGTVHVRDLGNGNGNNSSLELDLTP